MSCEEQDVSRFVCFTANPEVFKVENLFSLRWKVCSTAEQCSQTGSNVMEKIENLGKKSTHPKN